MVRGREGKISTIFVDRILLQAYFDLLQLTRTLFQSQNENSHLALPTLLHKTQQEQIFLSLEALEFHLLGMVNYDTI